MPAMPHCATACTTRGSATETRDVFEVSDLAPLVSLLCAAADAPPPPFSLWSRADHDGEYTCPAMINVLRNGVAVEVRSSKFAGGLEAECKAHPIPTGTPERLRVTSPAA